MILRHARHNSTSPGCGRKAHHDATRRRKSPGLLLSAIYRLFPLYYYLPKGKDETHTLAYNLQDIFLYFQNELFNILGLICSFTLWWFQLCFSTFSIIVPSCGCYLLHIWNQRFSTSVALNLQTLIWRVCCSVTLISRRIPRRRFHPSVVKKQQDRQNLACFTLRLNWIQIKLGEKRRGDERSKRVHGAAVARVQHGQTTGTVRVSWRVSQQSPSDLVNQTAADVERGK